MSLTTAPNPAALAVRLLSPAGCPLSRAVASWLAVPAAQPGQPASRENQAGQASMASRLRAYPLLHKPFRRST